MFVPTRLPSSTDLALRRSGDRLLVLGLVVSMVAHVGLVYFLGQLRWPKPVPKPPQLTEVRILRRPPAARPLPTSQVRTRRSRPKVASRPRDLSVYLRSDAPAPRRTRRSRRRGAGPKPSSAAAPTRTPETAPTAVSLASVVSTSDPPSAGEASGSESEQRARSLEAKAVGREEREPSAMGAGPRFTPPRPTRGELPSPARMSAVDAPPPLRTTSAPELEPVGRRGEPIGGTKRLARLPDRLPGDDSTPRILTGPETAAETVPEKFTRGPGPSRARRPEPELSGTVMARAGSEEPGPLFVPITPATQELPGRGGALGEEPGSRGAGEPGSRGAGTSTGEAPALSAAAAPVSEGAAPTMDVEPRAFPGGRGKRGGPGDGGESAAASTPNAGGEVDSKVEEAEGGSRDSGSGGSGVGDEAPGRGRSGGDGEGADEGGDGRGSLLKRGAGGVYVSTTGRYLLPGAVTGSDYMFHVQALNKMLDEINSRTKLHVTLGRQYLRIRAGGFRRAPVVVFTGHRAFELNDEQRVALRQYVEGGGMIWADFSHAPFDDSFRDEMERIFGNRPSALGSGHTIYRSFYVLNGAPAGDVGDPAPFEGITVGDRLGVVITPNRYFAAVSGPPRVSADVQEGAFKAIVNIYVYAAAQYRAEQE